MGIKRQALGDLFDRYKAVFNDAWKNRDAMTPVIRTPQEAEFLPATLALQETPIHPAPRVFMWLIISFALVTLLWAMLGKMDVVATASGKIVPDSRSKTVQPLEVAAIHAIHVSDGQLVNTGDVLIELDATASQADVARLREETLVAALDVSRYQQLLSAQQHKQKLQLSFENVVDKENAMSIDNSHQWAQGEWDSYQASLAQLEASINRREADERATHAVVEKYRETLPIIQQREMDYRDLLDKKFIAKHEYLELKTSLIEQERDLAVQKERLAEMSASRVEAEREKMQFMAETRRLWLDKFNEAKQRHDALKQELVKAETRGRYMTLRAPVDGVVQQLAVHTQHGVVTPAQTLMVIVPQEGLIEVEAFLPNKDVGFVRAGQTVEVKLETFSFTKYGTVDGEVISVSSDAIQDEKMGLVYSMRVRLLEDHLFVEGNKVKLSAGMAATVEIKIKQRRVIEYFLDPLLKHTSESLRER